MTMMMHSIKLIKIMLLLTLSFSVTHSSPLRYVVPVSDFDAIFEAAIIGSSATVIIADAV